MFNYYSPFQEILYRGRIRVQLRNDDGTPVKKEFPTRELVMKYIGESIPKLKTRQNRYFFLISMNNIKLISFRLIQVRGLQEEIAL